MNGYKLTRDWFEWCSENPEKIRPIHSALYLFAVDQCNRFGWKSKFGFPTYFVMDILGIGNWRTYSKALNELVEFGFIEIVRKSPNRHKSTIISIVKNTELSTELSTEQEQGNVQSKDSATAAIDKPINSQTSKQLKTSKPKRKKFNFKNKLIEYGFKENLVDDWLEVRKTKRATNTETAFKLFIKEFEKSGKGMDFILESCIEKSWASFKNEYLKSKNQVNYKNEQNERDEPRVNGQTITSATKNSVGFGE